MVFWLVLNKMEQANKQTNKKLKLNSFVSTFLWGWRQCCQTSWIIDKALRPVLCCTLNVTVTPKNRWHQKNNKQTKTKTTKTKTKQNRKQKNKDKKKLLYNKANTDKACVPSRQTKCPYFHPHTLQYRLWPMQLLLFVCLFVFPTMKQNLVQRSLLLLLFLLPLLIYYVSDLNLQLKLLLPQNQNTREFISARNAYNKYNNKNFSRLKWGCWWVDA